MVRVVGYSWEMGLNLLEPSLGAKSACAECGSKPLDSRQEERNSCVKRGSNRYRLVKIGWIVLIISPSSYTIGMREQTYLHFLLRK
jgi:hypothetical protein